MIAQGASQRIWLDLIFVAALVAITVIDLEHQIIPDRIVAPLALAAIVLTADVQPHHSLEHLIAGAAAGGFLFVAVMAYPAGMGMGDVKLAAVMGLVLGRAVAPRDVRRPHRRNRRRRRVMARKGVRDGRKTRIPFGPFLALGASSRSSPATRLSTSTYTGWGCERLEQTAVDAEAAFPAGAQAVAGSSRRRATVTGLEIGATKASRRRHASRAARSSPSGSRAGSCRRDSCATA